LRLGRAVDGVISGVRGHARPAGCGAAVMLPRGRGRNRAVTADDPPAKHQRRCVPGLGRRERDKYTRRESGSRALLGEFALPRGRVSLRLPRRRSCAPAFPRDRRGPRGWRARRSAEGRSALHARNAVTRLCLGQSLRGPRGPDRATRLNSRYWSPVSAAAVVAGSRRPDRRRPRCWSRASCRAWASSRGSCRASTPRWPIPPCRSWTARDSRGSPTSPRIRPIPPRAWRSLSSRPSRHTRHTRRTDRRA